MPNDCREIWIYCGRDAWEQFGDDCAANPGRVVLPDGSTASAFSWPVIDREVLIVAVGDADDDLLLELAHECLRQGATVARCLDTSLTLSVHRAREVANGVA